MTSAAGHRPYAGNALVRVNAGGRARLPDFALRVLERHPSTIFVGLHPVAPCLLAFDSHYHEQLTEELRQAAAGEERQARMRRVFSTTAEIGWPCAHLHLPELARRKALIGERALFVGIGGAIEIWDPEVATRSGDEVLGELASLHLTQAARA